MDDTDYADYARARWTALVHSAMLLGAGLAEAEDVAQATLVRCYLAWSKVQRAEDRDAYVARMLLNVFRGSRRRLWTGEVATGRLPDRVSDDRTVEVDGVDGVDRALGGLSPDHREVVVLRYYLHLSEQQIASTLGVAPGTVKSRLSRALDRLADSPHLTDLDGSS